MFSLRTDSFRAPCIAYRSPPDWRLRSVRFTRSFVGIVIDVYDDAVGHGIVLVNLEHHLIRLRFRPLCGQMRRITGGGCGQLLCGVRVAMLWCDIGRMA